MNSLFSYTASDSIIHRTPAGLKILLLFCVPVTVLLCPIEVCLVLIAVFPILALVGKIRLLDFLRDLRPIVIYCMMIVSIDVLSYLLFHRNDEIVTQRSLHTILRLLCAIEATSVFFRTTSTFETGSALQTVERVLTFGKSRLVLSGIFSLFLGFLPQIFATWSSLDLAYRARGGKKGISKALTLFPLLITMSMKKATTTYLALLNRS